MTPIAKPPYWTFSEKRVQEELSYAYVHAVAYMAGCKCERMRDDIGWDAKLSYVQKIRGKEDEGAELHLQLKATYRAKFLSDSIVYELDAGAYNRLVQRMPSVRLLVVLAMHPDVRKWMSSTEDSMSLYRCAYWIDLRGKDETDNDRSVTITIPRAQVFGVDAIIGELKRKAMRLRELAAK
ncbi:DUF4365 domain-containing protein [Sorangium sp. So ce426]|uniref:DUF4365 domain-containing protein n=1 Tax=Sorangium sp. So ce426 TaxID=3133312 RepID=UPI003F5C2012